MQLLLHIPTESVTLYEHADYKGRKLTLTESTPNLVVKGFNDIASSVEVTKGTWKLWKHVGYKGKSFIVTPGKYNIGEIREKIGNDVISSVELCEEGKWLVKLHSPGLGQLVCQTTL